MESALYQQMRRIEDHHWWFLGRRQIIKTIISGIPIPAEARILDAGCGTGGNLPLLCEFGEVYGMELEPAAAAIAKERNVATVAEGSFPSDIPFSDAEFDLITVLDVLEHIEDDVSTLQSIYRKLSAGGYMLLTVPAFPFLWSDHDVYHHHKRRYRLPGLKSIIQSAGLEVEYISYYNTLLFPAAVIARIISQILPSSEVGESADVPNKFLNKLFFTAFSSERHLLKKLRFPFGVSILALARKP